MQGAAEGTAHLSQETSATSLLSTSHTLNDVGTIAAQELHK